MRIKIDFQNYEKDYKSFDILALVTNIASLVSRIGFRYYFKKYIRAFGSSSEYQPLKHSENKRTNFLKKSIELF